MNDKIRRNRAAAKFGYRKAKAALILSFAIMIIGSACFSITPAAVSAENEPLIEQQQELVDKTKQAATVSTASFTPRSEARQAALSIIRLATDMASNKGELMVVKVPTYNFVGVLQEMQNRNAKFVLPNGKVPATAKVVFRLEADAGLSQIVYLPN